MKATTHVEAKNNYLKKIRSPRELIPIRILRMTDEGNIEMENLENDDPSPAKKNPLLSKFKVREQPVPQKIEE